MSDDTLYVSVDGGESVVGFPIDALLNSTDQLYYPVLEARRANSRWIGFRGRILEKPTLDVCTSQLDVGVDGDCARLADEMGGFHWMLCYGDHLRETGYALRKAGIEWLNLSEKAT